MDIRCARVTGSTQTVVNVSRDNIPRGIRDEVSDNDIISVPSSVSMDTTNSKFPDQQVAHGVVQTLFKKDRKILFCSAYIILEAPLSHTHVQTQPFVKRNH